MILMFESIKILGLKLLRTYIKTQLKDTLRRSRMDHIHSDYDQDVEGYHQYLKDNIMDEFDKVVEKYE